MRGLLMAGWSETPTSSLEKSPSRDAVFRLVAQRFPNKAYCLVEDWIVFRAALNQDELAKVNAAGHLPLFVFAHKVVEDSRGRFQPGDWVRSSMSLSRTDRCLRQKIRFTCSWGMVMRRRQA
jgi:hypothetical protein